MNTLLGEIATMNDIQYPVYRAAFKFRKLQRSFLLDHIDATTLQEAFHQTSIQLLSRAQVVPITQLRTFITELYSSLKILKPSLGAAKLKQAQELLFNFLQMVYLTSMGGSIDAGSLKIVLCLLSGAKPFDKSRYVFSILASHSGTVDSSGIGYFCDVTQKMASSVQEQLYSQWSSVNVIFHDCLTTIRSAEDIEDEEELDGGVKRPWLSQFEFTKLFTSSPAPKFLGWLALFHKLPTLEAVIHPVRCCVCTRKPIISFRYQCTECPNFNLCQMCFLKGRTTDKHLESHQILEISTGSKGNKTWKHRLLGISSRQPVGRMWNETKEPFVYSPRTSQTSLVANEQIDSAVNSISDMLNHSHQTLQRKGLDSAPRSHLPAMIRISSDDSITKAPPAKPVSQLVNGVSAKSSKSASPSKNQTIRTSVSTTSSGGSPDSISSGGAKFNFDGTLSSASSDMAWHRSSNGNMSSSPGSDVHSSPTHEGVSGGGAQVANPGVMLRPRDSSADSEDLTAINRRLSREVDQLLSELPPPSTRAPLKLTTHKLNVEGQSLEGQVSSLTDRRARLSGELNGLVSQLQQMQTGFVGLRDGGNSNPLYTSPMHSRCDSAPMDAYPRVGSASPPTLRTRYPPDDSHGSMRKLRDSQLLLDPLVEFTPDQLSTYKTNNVVSPEAYRMSVAW